ncbi:asparagine synthase-related protein [Streptomyces albireticuli]|uniref:asparagine synthase-related protein n=1 Tax=Streptomyces albireticuli TaxID=1940 RepID=UPI0014738104
MRHRLADALAAAADELTKPPERLAAWTDSQDLARIGADTSGWRTLALDEHGIEIAAPYLDNEVRRACLAVPADQRGTPGRYKPLLAEAFAGTDVLPDFVLDRATKGGFNALSYAGLVQHAPALRRLLGPSSRLGAMGLVADGPVGGDARSCGSRPDHRPRCLACGGRDRSVAAAARTCRGPVGGDRLCGSCVKAPTLSSRTKAEPS